MRFEVFVILNMWTMFFGVLKLCSLVGVYQHFGGIYRLHLP
jgi:hypothetical protein